MKNKIPNTIYWTEAEEPKSSRCTAARFRKIVDKIQIWWLDTSPLFGLCFDCGTKGLITSKFDTFMSGSRVTGKPFTAAGLCISCAISEQPDEDLPSQ
tara:strand:- start:76 stop:369 length:294 start_codon:yes stop_codon:yes gene_type:complete